MARVLYPYGLYFSALSLVFCRLMASVLPPYVILEAQYKLLVPYGLCFAALCNFGSAVQKSVAFFWGGGGVKASLWTAFCCQQL